MNRAIKFRAWDRKDNRFLLTLSGGACFSYPNRMSIGLNEILLANNNKGIKGYEFYWFLGVPRFILQQFTGLLDKHGREIYDGDIVTTHHFDSWNDETGFDVIQVVKWCDYHVGWRGFTSRMLNNPKVAGNGLPSPITVIGNTFENTDLLK